MHRFLYTRDPFLAPLPPLPPTPTPYLEYPYPLSRVHSSPKPPHLLHACPPPSNPHPPFPQPTTQSAPHPPPPNSYPPQNPRRQLQQRIVALLIPPSCQCSHAFLLPRILLRFWHVLRLLAGCVCVGRGV